MHLFDCEYIAEKYYPWGKKKIKHVAQSLDHNKIVIVVANVVILY